jgi:hypothetical protein
MNHRNKHRLVLASLVVVPIVAVAIFHLGGIAITLISHRPRHSLSDLDEPTGEVHIEIDRVPVPMFRIDRIKLRRHLDEAGIATGRDIQAADVHRWLSEVSYDEACEVFPSPWDSSYDPRRDNLYWSDRWETVLGFYRGDVITLVCQFGAPHVTCRSDRILDHFLPVPISEKAREEGISGGHATAVELVASVLPKVALEETVYIYDSYVAFPKLARHQPFGSLIILWVDDNGTITASSTSLAWIPGAIKIGEPPSEAGLETR